MQGDKREFNILVIEDNPGDFALVEEFLLEQIEILTIAHAKSYQEARNVLSAINNPFDIVLLDLSLPDKTGLSLIKEVAELVSNTPVIVLTGYTDFDFGVRSLSLGISDYILKEELTAISLYKSIVYSLERKKAVSALEVSEKRYSELFHLSPLPMFVFETDTLNFLDVNAAFIKHYGYTRDEFLLMNLKQIRPAEEIPMLEKRLMKSAEDKSNANLGVFNHLKKNGEIIQVDIQSNFIDYKGKKAKVTIASDITERLNYIKAIEEQNQKLREISWIQSHVVRAPLARIMGLIQIFKDVNSCAEDKEATLDYILLSANELDNVIREITDKTKIAEDDDPMMKN
ncbi:MAG: response regulator [Sphingobacteriales bacterium]